MHAKFREELGRFGGSHLHVDVSIWFTRQDFHLSGDLEIMTKTINTPPKNPNINFDQEEEAFVLA